MRRHISVFILAVLFSLLGACGGSDNKGNVPIRIDPPLFPVNDSVSAFMQSDNSYTMSTMSGGHSYEMSLSWKAGSQRSFQGTPAFTTTKTQTITKDGAPFSRAVTTDYFLLGPYKRLGSITDTGQTLVATDQAVLPDLAMAGQSGDLDREDAFFDHVINTWILAGGSSDDLADFVVHSTIEGEAILPQKQSLGLEIDSRGHVHGINVSLPLDGSQVSFSTP